MQLVSIILIHWISTYLVDSSIKWISVRQTSCIIHWIVVYLVDSMHYPSFEQLGPEVQNHSEQLFFTISFLCMQEFINFAEGNDSHQYSQTCKVRICIKLSIALLPRTLSVPVVTCTRISYRSITFVRS